MSEEERDWQEQIKEVAIDVRNEAIMQGASLYLLARRVLLAGLGAVALSMEEAQAFVDKLVERGEIAEADAQRLLQDFRERAKKQEAQIQKAGGEGAKQAENLVESQITAVLNRMNVPTKRDIDQLSQQIELLSAKIDSLRGRKQ
ncbi:MAG: phasin family protein [Caldilineaceae bacterium]|nr:phasin family protein [Caldilineaceae bacterium]